MVINNNDDHFQLNNTANVSDDNLQFNLQSHPTKQLTYQIKRSHPLTSFQSLTITKSTRSDQNPIIYTDQDEEGESNAINGIFNFKPIMNPGLLDSNRIFHKEGTTLQDPNPNPNDIADNPKTCLLYTSPSPRDRG